jgi:hypothetical protein
MTTIKEPIHLTNCIVNNDMIVITSTGTSYCNTTPIKLIDHNEMLASYKALIKLAKENDVKITYKYATKRNIIENNDAYMKDYKNHCELYSQLKLLWEEKLSVGMFYGHNNTPLDQEISDTSHAMSKLFYGQSPLSQMTALSVKIRDLMHELSDDDVSLVRIWL